MYAYINYVFNIFKKKSHHPTVVLWAQAAVLLRQCF